jgi:hypothetical protein
MGSISALENFVVDSYGSRDPDSSQLFSPEKELRLKGGLNLKFAHIQAERAAIEDLPVHVQAVNRAVLEHVTSPPAIRLHERASLGLGAHTGAAAPATGRAVQAGGHLRRVGGWRLACPPDACGHMNGVGLLSPRAEPRD